MGSNIKLEFFPESRIALSREVAEHPPLLELLQKHPQAEFEIILAEIATYCGVVLDGTYTQEDLDKLCDILFKRLRAKRSSILLLN